MSQSENLDILAHEPETVTFCTALVLPTANGLTPQDGGALGAGLALTRPSWANGGTVFVTYAEGVASSGSNVLAYLYASPDATGALAPADLGDGNGNPGIFLYTAPGGFCPLPPTVAGAARIGFAMKDSAATPGNVTIKVVWIRRPS